MTYGQNGQNISSSYYLLKTTENKLIAVTINNIRLENAVSLPDLQSICLQNLHLFGSSPCDFSRWKKRLGIIFDVELLAPYHGLFTSFLRVWLKKDLSLNLWFKIPILIFSDQTNLQSLNIAVMILLIRFDAQLLLSNDNPCPYYQGICFPQLPYVVITVTTHTLCQSEHIHIHLNIIIYSKKGVACTLDLVFVLASCQLLTLIVHLRLY